MREDKAKPLTAMSAEDVAMLFYGGRCIGRCIVHLCLNEADRSSGAIAWWLGGI